MNLIKSKIRVADHGEVFTPAWLVENMLDLVRGESERIDARFLEPACGNGNFLVPILRRKLAAVDAKFAGCTFERQHYALLALMSCYGIELLADNIAECQARMLALFADTLQLPDEYDETWRAASYVLSCNLVHGDAMRMRDAHGTPIRVAEWGYLGKGKFQRRDFLLNVLTARASASAARSLDLFAQHDVFTPIQAYPPMTLRDLAACAKTPQGAQA